MSISDVTPLWTAAPQRLMRPGIGCGLLGGGCGLGGRRCHGRELVLRT
ncbi:MULTISPECIES: hypothetical protein [Amycolatopsis]|nr:MULTISPECIES: hypothetical protein [Amycolatopsis]MCF6428383.1 hypothetical protein [Amycolatopsis tucumanensis]